MRPSTTWLKRNHCLKTTDSQILFGLSILCHCLRLPRNTPAQKALDLTVNNIPKAREDRPRTCLLSTLRAHLKRAATYPCHRQRQRGRNNRAHTLPGYSITAWVIMSLLFIAKEWYLPWDSTKKWTPPWMLSLIWTGQWPNHILQESTRCHYWMKWTT